MRQTDKYLFFYGGFLSQWYLCKFNDWLRDYNCAEQCMMAQKALLFEDIKSFDYIMKETNPAFQKARGRKIEGFNQEKWDLFKEAIVCSANYLKFAQNKTLRKKLLDTKDLILVEASPYDKIWGIGLSENNPLADDEKNWKGQNLLGKVLMKVRESLKNVDEQLSSLNNKE